MRARRLLRFQICPSILPMMFQTGKKFEVRKGVPADAEFRGYAIDHQTNTLMICVEHPSFPLVPEAELVPLAEPIEFVGEA